MSNHTQFFYFTMNNFKEERKFLAEKLKISHKVLSYVLYKQQIDCSYKEFIIPKKNGKDRIIHAPEDKLKRIQRKLGEYLTDIHNKYINDKEDKKYKEDKKVKLNISHGFVKGNSIFTNAKIHRNKRYVLNVDILEFFPPFHFGRVRGYFEKSKEFGLLNECATLIAQLTCYKGRLPQGAPTSPVISNLIFNIVDMRILNLAKKYKLDYTRYVDDMSFSTNDKKFLFTHKKFIEELINILEKSGFKINENKTRLEYFSSRQEVTGLTVNKKLNANKSFIKKTRAMANELYKTGKFSINGKKGTLNQLEGRFAFINQIDKENNKILYELENLKKGKDKENYKEKDKDKDKNKYKNTHKNKDKEEEKDKDKDKEKLKSNKKYISGLNTREKQYQKFLFYKYFFNPSKPTIVTEGKTDIVHIKAALKKYYKEYPKLISLKEDETFDFKIRFLTKTKRLRYFLGIEEDGADTMKNIYNFYTGNCNCRNLFDFFENITKNRESIEKKPVILLFDNEQKDNYKKKKKKKPLREFLNHVKIELSVNINTNIKSNLYLQTIPLINGMEQCEIEDLYDEKVRREVVDGKPFKIAGNYDKKTEYGKHDFSLYVLKNYKLIDFSKFKPILDSINNIC